MKKLFSLVLILSIIAISLFVITPATPAEARPCAPITGKSDVSAIYGGPFSVDAGTTMTITMKTDLPWRTWIGIIAYGGTAVSSYATGIQTVSYYFPTADNNVEYGLAWEDATQESNSYSVSFYPCGDPQPAPQTGMISISATNPQPVYEEAGGNVVRNADRSQLIIPQDYDGNGFDTYLIMSSTEIDGHLWYEIFLGDGSANVWVPASGVTVVE